MPRLVWSEAALQDLVRLHAFLVTKSPAAARRAAQLIRAGVKVLVKQPEIGRPTEGMLPGFREFIIDFGTSAYVVLYHFDGELVVLLAVRHGREAGY